MIAHLQDRLSKPLPGRQAQFRMAGADRLAMKEAIPAPPEDAKIACVLNLLYYDVDTLRLVLIERSVNPRDRHSGQVGFPGGRFEPSDGSLESVALREAEEEIGVPAGSVQILGRLTALYIPVSNYLVHPFVGFAERLPELKPQPGEVEQIITPALDFFRKPETRQSKDVVLDSGVTLKAVPCFHVEDKIIWGATAMILNEFLELLGDGSAC